MEDTDCYGYCNTCFQLFKKNDEIIFFEELKDKYLSIEFCSELCLNTCLKSFPFLRSYNPVHGIRDRAVERDNENLASLIERFPQFVISNYSDFYRSQQEIGNHLNLSIKIKDSLQVLHLLDNINVSRHPTLSGENFLKYCKNHKIY